MGTPTPKLQGLVKIVDPQGRLCGEALASGSTASVYVLSCFAR
jgi:hypothetical protein